MKNKLRKYLSVERRDLWDGPCQYLLGFLSVDKLKHMLKHRAKKDLRMPIELKEALKWRMHVKK
jgi:hypothetical protein